MVGLLDMGPCIFWFVVLRRLVFGGALKVSLGVGLSCPGYPFLDGPIQHFKSAIIDAWRDSVAADLCSRKGFRGGPFLDYVGSMQLLPGILRFLNRLPGGLRRFTPCSIGANHCRLRHIGLEKCGHGLASRPLETSDPGFLDALLQVCSVTLVVLVHCFWLVSCP